MANTLAQARSLLEQGAYRSVVICTDFLISSFITNCAPTEQTVEAFSIQGRALQLLGEHRRALLTFQRALEHNDGAVDANLLSRIAQCYQALRIDAVRRSRFASFLFFRDIFLWFSVTC